MRHLRLLFLAFSAALLAPLAFLVHRAVGSVEIERRMRHQVVAERIFDEMERALSRLLDAEEKQPFEGWGDGVGPAEFPFVIGHFQVDPDGRVRVLSVPAGEGRATSAEIERLAGSSWRAVRPVAQEHAAAPAQMPGTTLRLAEGKRQAFAGAEPAAPERPASADEVSAFDALRSLNKAVEERVARQRKGAEGNEYADAEAEMQKDDLARADASAAVGAFAPAPRRDLGDARRDEIELPPMTGRMLEEGRLLLRRTIVRGGKAYRQGVLVDVPRLAAWLRQEGVGNDGLAEFAEVSFGTRFAAASGGGGSAFVYRHRFAEPFADLSARLALRPLPGVGSVAYVYVLCALLLATGSLGLAALYRMVAVVVGFAERRSNFVAAVTHELKTPLTAIRMYGEMLRDGMVSSEAKRAEYYRHITQESERLTRLINNVLEFARLEKGNREVALAAGPVEPVVREVAEMLRPHVEGQGLELTVDVEDALPPVRFERDALVQVLCNLVDNAVKYAAGGSPRQIHLVCRRDDAAVTVAVRDHGPGVGSRHLGKIFAPFYRGENELTRKNKGVGLGLALVRGLADRMDARVSARNAPGGGFEVEIRFEDLVDRR